jgi:TolA-binding protein
MTRDPKTPALDTPDSGAKRRTARPDPTSLVLALEAIRDGVRERIDRIEALALERVSAGEAARTDESPEPNRALQQKVADLEEKLGRAQAEVRRRETEWRTAMEQLEDDRKLLAEAWERLERERIDVVAAPTSGTRHYTPQPSPPVAARPSVNSEVDNAVAHAVLQQFQALRGDVRSTSNGHRPRR